MRSPSPKPTQVFGDPNVEPLVIKSRLYTFIGSGGVGKTTLSAAWAYTLADQGFKVALITIDPAKRLAQSLGVQKLEGSLKPTSLHPQLWAMMLDQEETSRRLVKRFAASHAQAQKIFANRYFDLFSRALSGTQEMMAVYEVCEALESDLFDVVVLDTPPAQHALDFFDVPRKLGTALDGSALRWLIGDRPEDTVAHRASGGWRGKLSGLGKSVALRAFTKVTSAPFVEDLFEFLSLFGGVLSELRKRGGSLESLLQASSSALWVVGAPESSPLSACERVTDELKTRGFSVERWLINRVPSLLHEALADQSLADREVLRRLSALDQEGRAELLHYLNDQSSATRDTALGVWSREVERANGALGVLNRLTDHAVEITLIEELSRALPTLDRLMMISAQLRLLLKSEMRTSGDTL